MYNETHNKWFNVKEKMPPYNIDVLTYSPDMAMKVIVNKYILYYGEDDNEEYIEWQFRNKETELPTYWTYIPSWASLLPTT